MSQTLSPVEYDTGVIAPNVNPASSPPSQSTTPRDTVRAVVKEYFLKLDGAKSTHFYELFLAEIELPLLEVVLRYTGDNQSAAARSLSISRGTLRKKMKKYGLLHKKKKIVSV